MQIPRDTNPPGNEHSSFLDVNHNVYVCGYNDSGQSGIGHTRKITEPTLVPALVGVHVKQVFSSNGSEHIAAITEDGHLYTWGFNSRGQLGHDTLHPVSVPKLVESLVMKRVVQVAWYV